MEKFYPTKAGLEYAALTAQGKIIEFTKGKFGDGIRSIENIAELTDLIHPLGELPISKKSVKNSTIITTTQFSNRVGSSILPTFYLTEIGLFAKLVNVDGTDDKEHPATLIGYAFDVHGDKISGTSLSEFIINIPLTVANADNVIVDIDSLVYPTLKQFEDEINKRTTEDEKLQDNLNEHTNDKSINWQISIGDEQPKGNNSIWFAPYTPQENDDEIILQSTDYNDDENKMHVDMNGDMNTVSNTDVNDENVILFE